MSTKTVYICDWCGEIICTDFTELSESELEKNLRPVFITARFDFGEYSHNILGEYSNFHYDSEECFNKSKDRILSKHPYSRLDWRDPK